MATRILGPTGSRRRRRTFLSCLVVALGVSMLFVAGALGTAPQTAGYFELDKNAVNDLSTYHVGSLKSAVRNATATTISVCERTGGGIPSGNPPPSTPFKIQIDGEKMVVTAYSTASSSTGGCSFSDPNDTTLDVRTYTVTRGTDSTTAIAHPSGSDVTGYVNPDVKTGTDWNVVYNDVQANPATEANPNPCANSANGGTVIANSVACSWAKRNGTAFTTGGSKDDLNINDVTSSSTTINWQWANTSVPDADDITDAYAIKFADPVNEGDGKKHQFLYFGADRFATNGAKDFGFWFFKNPVTAAADGTFRDDLGNPAQHALGDVLILGTFTQGGAVTSVRTYTWIGTGGDTNNTLNTGPVGPDCVPGGSSDLCNTINNTTTDSPWDYVAKGAVSQNVFYSGSAMEGGIDLTAANLEGCFSSFLAETRSSPSIGAQLKAFILEKFQPCGATIATTPSSTSDGNTPIPDAGISVGTGNSGVDVYDKAVVTVSGTDTYGGNVTYHLCGPTPLADANYTLCDGTTGHVGVQIGSSTNISGPSPSTVVSDAAHLTEAGRYCWRGDYSGDTANHISAKSDSSVNECFKVIPVTPNLTTCSGTYGGDPLVCTPDGTVDFGTAVRDSANLTGTAYEKGTGGPTGSDGSINPTARATKAQGTITFKLYGPDTAGSTTNCNVLAAGFVTAHPNGIVVNVDGDGVYGPTGVSFTPLAPGVYHWKASYSGDLPNTNSKDTNSLCSDTNEDVTVRLIPTDVKTKQSWFPNDTATITSTILLDNLGAGGTVDFTLYNTDTCSGTALYTERQTLTGGSHSEEVATHNYTGSTALTPGGSAVTPYREATGYPDGADSTVGPNSWKVVYTPASGDTAHTGSSSACTALHTEKHTITYTNDPGH